MRKINRGEKIVMPLTQPELNQLRSIARKYTERVVELTRRICAVPAPTGNERARAEFVASVLRERGYTPTLDEVGNVYTRRGKRGQGPLVMLLAHTDTVFPLNTPLKIERHGDVVHGPGIGDNSVSVASMISTLEMLDELGRETPVDIMAVADVGEEGLGNLLGARTAVERYLNELGAVLVIDGGLGRIITTAVGSKRWKVTVHGPGGHSYGAFGRPSAIHGLGRIIAAIADLEVPSQPKTTFNVGLIEGGTSVNTIAASASAVIDMRSTDVVMLDKLSEQVKGLIEQRVGVGLRTEIQVLGERPAGRRSESDPLVQLAAQTLTWLGREPKFGASSTDANIPISLNIPSICVGITHTEQAHTVEEHLYVPPISDGLAQILRLCIDTTELVATQKQ